MQVFQTSRRFPNFTVNKAIICGAIKAKKVINNLDTVVIIIRAIARNLNLSILNGSAYVHALKM